MSRRRERRPDFSGARDDITEIMHELRTGECGGLTVPFAGASDAGVMPGAATEPFPAPEPRPRGQLRAVPPPDRDVPGFQEMRLHADGDRVPVAEQAARGWAHLFTIRCGYPAASHDTPIPCGAEHRDPDVGTFRRLRLSAQAAGWHLDAYGRWACPACQMTSEYRTLYPVTFWHQDWAAGPAWDEQQRDFGLHRFLVGVEEARWIRDTKDASQRGKHRLTLAGPR